MTVLQELIPILGSITAAIIAGSISFIITVLSKDQKTSEFRQNWIDALRNEVSELVSLFQVMLSSLKIREQDGQDKKSQQNYMLEKCEDFIKMEACATKIRLRLNPEEHVTLLLLLSKLNGGLKSKEEAASTILQIVEESQKILKIEWNRVKKGELSFRATKWGSLIIFSTALIAGIIYVTGHFAVVYVP